MADVQRAPAPVHQMNAKQHAFCADVTSQAILLSGGYGSGKTYAACRKAAILAAENAGTVVGIVGPTWRQLKRDVMRDMPDLLDALGATWRHNRMDQTITVPAWRWQFDLCSAEDPSTMKGPNWSSAVVNEPGIMREEAWEVIISRVRDPRARVLQTALTGTPEGFNWLHKHFVSKPPAGYRVIYTATTDNPASRPEHVALMRATFSAALAQEKIEGQFVNTQSGRVYYEFSQAAHVRPDLSAEPGYPLMVALDFNVSPFAAVIIQQVGDETRALKEITLTNASTREMASAIAGAVHPQIPQRTPVYADASGRARSTQAGVSDFAILEEAGFTDIRVPAANPPVRDRVNAVNSRLRNALGSIRLVVSPSCPELIADFDTVAWKASATGADIDKRNQDRTHWSDALGYYIAREFPIVGGPGGMVIG